MPPDFPAFLIRDFPEEFEIARNASDKIIQCSAGKDFSALTRHSPGLVGFNWNNYIELSTIRMVRALRMVREYCSQGATILDVGSYFGNFSLMLTISGFNVLAVDSYDQYGECFSAHKNLLLEFGVDISSFEFLETAPAGSLDGALLMGVIEHIPHTPRHILERIHRLLKRDGLLVLDTPNLGYIYNRQKLLRGESIFPPIQSQYWTELPFEGHHREFTESEVTWMLSAAGFQVIESELFNYSLYGLTELAGIDLENYNAMSNEPSLRELQIHAAFAAKSDAIKELSSP